MKIIIFLSALVLSGCVSSKPKTPERLITVTKTVFEQVPREFLDCPLPPIVEPSSLENEEDYNREFVLELYSNNINCFESMQSISRWNLEIQEMNSITTTETLDSE